MTDKQRPKVTTVHQNVDIGDVRKSLACIRKQWRMHNEDTILSISDRMLDSTLSMSTFCFHFVIGHHLRRQLHYGYKLAQRAAQQKSG